MPYARRFARRPCASHHEECAWACVGRHIAKREVMLVKHLGLTRGPGAGGNEFENTIVDGNATDVRMLLEKQEE